MTRFTTNRAIVDWIKTKGSQPAGLEMQTSYQATFDLDARTAPLLLGHLDDALASDLHESKRNAFEQSRKHLLDAFPELG